MWLLFFVQFHFLVYFQKCHRCQLTMEKGAFALFASRTGVALSFHTGCFTCATCKELLVDNIFFYRNGDIYCGRHYADLVYPRCCACDEVHIKQNLWQSLTQSEWIYKVRWSLLLFCYLWLRKKKWFNATTDVDQGWFVKTNISD